MTAPVAIEGAAAAARRSPFIGRLLATLAAIACAALAVVYWTRPDSCAAITVCPAWIWSVPALLALIGYGLARRGCRAVWVALVLWLAYLPATADTPRALWRSTAGTGPPPRAGAEPVRVVSLNCGSFGGRSAQDIASTRPQIVLLQESPGPDEVAALAEQLFGDRGGFLWTSDASVVADGRVEPLRAHDRRQANAAFARVQLASGAEVSVVSLRLTPAIVRVDFWSPACWRSQSQNRRTRRAELARIVARLADSPRDAPLLIGGDFNAPAGDGALDALPDNLRDSFREGGAGWGNTIINEFPFARIDQIWIDDRWRAGRVFAQRSERSDHRLVIADLWLAK